MTASPACLSRQVGDFLPPAGGLPFLSPADLAAVVPDGGRACFVACYPLPLACFPAPYPPSPPPPPPGGGGGPQLFIGAGAPPPPPLH